MPKVMIWLLIQLINLMSSKVNNLMLLAHSFLHTDISFASLFEPS